MPNGAFHSGAAMIPQQAVMKDALNEARCSNKLLENLEHLHETNDLFGNVAKSQGQCPGILNGPQCRDTETRRGCSQTDTVSVETRSRLSSAFSDGPTTVNVISSSRLAEASRERNDTAKIAIDVRPGGPTAKRQPSPEGLGNRSRRGSERRRRGTKPIIRSPLCH